MSRISFSLLCFLLFFQFGNSQIHDKTWHRIALSKDVDFLKSAEARRIAENVLLYQKNNGGWEKNVAMHKTLSPEEIQKLIATKNNFTVTTIDNDATSQEMRFLASVYQFQPEKKFSDAFLKGVDYLLKAQYENGGWPQFYPIQNNYSSHITFNDDAMANVLFLFQELLERRNDYPIKIPAETLSKIESSFNKGIDAILKTQYRQNGKLTVWCTQHDEFSLFPAKARAYELPSLSGKESATLVLLLMSLKNPSKEVIRSVESAVNWFKVNKITGFREIRINGDKQLVKDENANPIWARFSDLETNQPFVSDRDGIRKKSYDEIGAERRNGYAWFIEDPAEVLRQYESWKKLNVKIIPDKNYYTISKDGSGDFDNIQEAIDHCKSFPDQRMTLFVKNGIYKEKVSIHQWNTNLKILGESKERTIISFNDYFEKIDRGRNSTFFTPTFSVEANDTVLENLTIENSAGDVGQAIALSVVANRVAVINCKLLGNQDTLYLGNEGKVFIKNTYIEGTTDFIFGGATAFFENCEIHSKKNSFITAPSTPKGTEFGFVFHGCKLTADDGVTEVFLGRPWRNFAQSVFINSGLGSHISPKGWDNWNKKDAEKTVFFAEYGNHGKGAVLDSRVNYAKQLSKKESRKFAKENILKDPLQKKWYENL